jgi:hypothetical protein
VLVTSEENTSRKKDSSHSKVTDSLTDNMDLKTNKKILKIEIAEL